MYVLDCRCAFAQVHNSHLGSQSADSNERSALGYLDLSVLKGERPHNRSTRYRSRWMAIAFPDLPKLCEDGTLGVVAPYA